MIDCENLVSGLWFSKVFEFATDEKVASSNIVITNEYIRNEGELYVASTYDKILTVYSKGNDDQMSENESNEILDLEFDSNITALKWCEDGPCLCLLVGDEDGVIHFVTPEEGRVLLSHQ